MIAAAFLAGAVFGAGALLLAGLMLAAGLPDVKPSHPTKPRLVA